MMPEQEVAQRRMSETQIRRKPCALSSQVLNATTPVLGLKLRTYNGSMCLEAFLMKNSATFLQWDELTELFHL